MELKSLNLSVSNVSKVNKKFNNSKINFTSNDVIDFSSVAKEKITIAQDLQKIGFTSKEVSELIKEYYETQTYKNLTQGDEDYNNEPIHYVEIDRNLTPSEAIVYQALEMDDYYAQYAGSLPCDYEKGSIESQDWDLKSADFLPLDVAKLMLQGFDIVEAGMILKGEIDTDTAKKVQKYYNYIDGNYENMKNVQQAECDILKLSQNIEQLTNYTDSKKASEMGLLRPLSIKEATTLVDCDYLRNDVKSLNHYIQLNKTFGYSLIDVDFLNLWDKSIEEIEEERSLRAKIVKPRTPQHFIDLQDKIEYLMKKYQDHSEFYEDLMLLDSDKFFKRLPAAAIKFDAIMSITCKRELTQKNIQVLNSISPELLDKMTKRDENSDGTFACLHNFLKTPDLDKRVAHLEEFRIQSPKFFEAMPRTAVLDYLSNSNMYSRCESTIDEFRNMLTGVPVQEPKDADIIEFPNKFDE